MKRTAAALAGSFGVFLLADCARRAPVTAPAPPRAEGQSSYQFLPDPDAPKPNLLPDERFIPPSPIGDLPPPPYPDEALRALAAPATIGVRIVVGTDGSVTGVTDSPLVASTVGPWSPLFRSLVEDAVRGWRFTPAEIRRLAEGKDLDGDGKPDYKVAISQTYVAVHLDVRFTFEIVGGKGRVRANVAGD